MEFAAILDSEARRWMRPFPGTSVERDYRDSISLT